MGFAALPRDYRHAWRARGVGQEIKDLLPVIQSKERDGSIINALVAANTMEGINGSTIYGLPADRLRAVLGKYNCLVDAENKLPGK